MNIDQDKLLGRRIARFIDFIEDISSFQRTEFYQQLIVDPKHTGMLMLDDCMTPLNTLNYCIGSNIQAFQWTIVDMVVHNNSVILTIIAQETFHTALIPDRKELRFKLNNDSDYKFKLIGISNLNIT